MRIGMDDHVRARPIWMLLSQLVVVAVLGLLLAASGRGRVPMDPMLLGLLLALAVTGARLVLAQSVQPAPALRYLSRRSAPG